MDTSAVRYWPALHCHRDRRCWRPGLRSSSEGPIHTTWQRETQRGRHTRQEEGEGVRSLARSFSHHALSLVDPCDDLHRAEIHSSHHSHGNHHLKIRQSEKREGRSTQEKGFSKRKRHSLEKTTRSLYHKYSTHGSRSEFKLRHSTT